MQNHGFLLINKEPQWTSFDVVNKIRKITGLKTGHCGTLDPFACGLLIIACGKATKFIEYLMNQNKEYIFEASWGVATDSYDLTGNIVQTSNIVPNIAQIKETLPQFIGKQQQQPPIFSALKVKGRPAYDYARKGEEVKLLARAIEIFNFELINATQISAKFKIKCSKGTYVRSVVNDLCAQLGCLGHVSYLQRTKIAKFNLSKAISLSDFEKSFKIKNHFLEVDEVIDFLSSFEINQKLYDKLKYGAKTHIKNLPFRKGKTIRARFNGNLFAVATYNDNILHPVKVLNNSSGK